MPIPAAVISALATVGSAIASSGIQAAASNRANNRSYRQTRELYGIQQADRDAQNAYSAPAASIARLKAAGLSPASFYGNPSAAGPSVGSVAPGSPEVNTPDLAGALSSGVSSGISTLLASAQKKNIEANTENQSAGAIKNLSDAAKTDKDRELLEEVFDTKVAQESANLAKTLQDTVLSDAQTKLARVEKEYREVGIELTRSQIGLNDKQKELWNKEIEKMGFEMSELSSRTSLNYAEVRVANETARQICFSIEHMMPVMIADYAASADLKSTQAWDEQEKARFQQWYNENMVNYLPSEIQAKIDNMNKQTKILAQQNVRDWIKLPSTVLRDTGVGVGALASPVGSLFGGSPARIGF